MRPRGLPSSERASGQESYPCRVIPSTARPSDTSASTTLTTASGIMSDVETAAVIELVTGTIPILSTIRYTHHGLKDGKYLPKAFHEVAERLPIAEDTLKQIHVYLNDRAGRGSTSEAIRPVMAACREKARRLKEIFDHVAPQPDASRLDRYRNVVRQLGKGSLVESLMKGIMYDLQLLVQTHRVRAAAGLDVKLADAIRELSAVPSSLPELEDNASIMQSHWGSGHNIAGDLVHGSKVESITGTVYLGQVTGHPTASAVKHF